MIEEIFGNGHRSLFVAALWEPRDNSLSVVILEGRPQGPEVAVDDLGITAKQILPDPEAQAIEVQWTDCILYAVSNESYALAEPGEAPPSRMLVERKNSRFLDYVRASTWATDEHPGPIRHWVLYCENQVIDVACLEPPIVTRVPVLPQWLEPRGPRIFQR